MSRADSMSTLAPVNLADLAQHLAQAHRDRSSVGRPNLRHLNQLLAHVPEDMTVTVEAGMTLAALQNRLAPHAQWVPIDPPHPESLTIGELLAFDRSGPRRYGYGGIRDHVIGMRVALADGRVVKSGGQVVKNVAGFDLLKLFIGDHGSLGVVVEVTFKLLPSPKATATFDHPCPDLKTAGSMLSKLWDSPITPVAIDLYHLGGESQFTLRTIIEGTTEEVAWQEGEIRRMGFHPASAEDWESRFWQKHAPSAIHPHSVLPSRLTEGLCGFMGEDFVARAGNGIIYSRSTGVPPASSASTELSRKVKETFDPYHILPELPT